MDAVQSALQGAAVGSAWAPLLGFVAGLASSFGPCIAPRFVAIASLTAGTSGAKRWTRVAAFVGGLCASYVLLGTLAGALGYLARYSGYVYALLATGLIVAGFATLAGWTGRRGCAHDGGGRAVAPGAALLGGGAFAAVSSPCCGPIAAALAGIGSASGNAWFGASVLGAFALGHAVPLIAVAAGSMKIATSIGTRLEPALTTLGGSLMLALGSYYALLA